MAVLDDSAPQRTEVLTKISSCMRREHRLVCERALELVEWSTRHRLSAKLIDYSESGMGLTLRAAMAAGSQYLIEGITEKGLLVYLVKSCNPISGEQFRVGAELCGYVCPEGDDHPETVLNALRMHCPVVSLV